MWPSQTSIFHWKNSFRCRHWAAKIRDAACLSPERLEALRWQRVKQLVEHCARHVPYYRQLFRKIRFDPRDLSDWSALQQLPILEKDLVRERQDDFRADNVPQRFFQPGVTGGSTGRPLEVFVDRRVPTSTLSNRILNWWGVDVSDNCGYLYRAVPKGIRKQLIDLALFPTRRAYIHAAEMTAARMQSFYDALRRNQATYLVGYVGAIDAFSDFLQQTGQAIPSLRAVWTTAAPLPEFKRQSLERTYDCPVYTQYGSVEISFLAAECELQQGMHVFDDVRHLEIVQPAEVVEPCDAVGDIVVTDLLNYAFPLLRYRLGDRGRRLPRNCPCGRPFSRMDYVRGRISDSIRLPDGTSIPGEFWTTIFDDWPSAIKAFQVHQDRNFDVVIHYQPTDGQAAMAINSVRRELMAKLRGLVRLDFMECSVDVNDNGKTRYVISAL